ncbi:MAG: site-specific integrase [Polyangia bacterium]|jgi:integrase
MARKPRRRNWGAGTITTSGKRWGVRWYENGRRRFKAYPSRELAEQVLAKIVSEMAVEDAGLHRDYDKAPNLDTLAAAWVERRLQTHRAAKDDGYRWKLHLGPTFGRMKPHEIDGAKLRRFIEGKLAEGLSPTTVGHCIRQLSTFYSDIIEAGHAPANPVASLPRSTRRLFKSIYDTRSTPFLERPEDVRRLYLAMAEPYNLIFIFGEQTGCRVGEILGMQWRDVDLPGRKIHVRQQMQDGRLCALKDKESRIVPLSTTLAPILEAWKLKTGGVGQLFVPANLRHGGRPDIGSPAQFIRPITVHKALAKALAACELPKMTLYQCTRHTFASQWVMNGGNMEVLAKIMGHSSTSTTQHYAHLAPDFFGAKAFDMVAVDLSKPASVVLSLRDVPGPLGQRMGRKQGDGAERNLA